MIALEIARKLKKSLVCLEVLKSIPAWQIEAEAKLSSELQALFAEVFENTVNEFLKLGTVPSGDFTRAQLVEAFWEVEEDYNVLLESGAMEAAAHGRNRVISGLQKVGNSIGFSGLPGNASRIIKEHAFEASQMTLERMTGDVMGNLEGSFREGLGISEAADRLRETFDNMQNYELERIARTEIQSAQNEGAYLTEQELGIGYHMWFSAQDSRVRDSHVDMHGQIVKIGNLFSNGLRYPGDRTGDIKEWINCRCRLVPFLMPEGMRAPTGRAYFYETDLVAA